MENTTAENQTDKMEKISSEILLQEIKLALKDIFIAKIHLMEDEVSLTFPNGQRFIFTIWEDKLKNT